jgi:hypothetical protein
MSAARTLLEEARAAGFAIACQGGRLRVKPTILLVLARIPQIPRMEANHLR